MQLRCLGCCRRKGRAAGAALLRCPPSQEPSALSSGRGGSAEMGSDGMIAARDGQQLKKEQVRAGKGDREKSG